MVLTGLRKLAKKSSATPATATLKNKKVVTKAVEEEVENELEDEVEEEVVVTKTTTKAKAVAKPVVKAAAKPAVKTKAVTKAKVETEEDEDDEVAPTKSSGGLFGAAKPKTAVQRELVTGDVMPREEIHRRFAEKMGCTIADASRGLKSIEEFFLEEVFPEYSCNLFGVRFKRKVVGARVYAGTGGLKVENPLATEVSEHICVSANIMYDRESKKGLVDDETGEFVEGTINAKGKFIPA